MPKFRQDHIHLRSRDPEATARYYHDMFDGKIVESIQTDGRPRVDVDIDGLTICIAQAQPGHDTAPDRPYIGLDHFGLQVEDLDEAVAELKKRGAEFFSEPRLLRPGLKIAFRARPGRRPDRNPRKAERRDVAATFPGTRRRRWGARCPALSPPRAGRAARRWPGRPRPRKALFL